MRKLDRRFLIYLLTKFRDGIQSKTFTQERSTLVECCDYILDFLKENRCATKW